jgi:hypothetical protein
LIATGVTPFCQLCFPTYRGARAGYSGMSPELAYVPIFLHVSFVPGDLRDIYAATSLSVGDLACLF